MLTDGAEGGSSLWCGFILCICHTRTCLTKHSSQSLSYSRPTCFCGLFLDQFLDTYGFFCCCHDTWWHVACWGSSLSVVDAKRSPVTLWEWSWTLSAVWATCHLGQWLPPTPQHTVQTQEHFQCKAHPSRLHIRAPQSSNSSTPPSETNWEIGTITKYLLTCNILVYCAHHSTHFYYIFYFLFLYFLFINLLVLGNN